MQSSPRGCLFPAGGAQSSRDLEPGVGGVAVGPCPVSQLPRGYVRGDNYNGEQRKRYRDIAKGETQEGEIPPESERDPGKGQRSVREARKGVSEEG